MGEGRAEVTQLGVRDLAEPVTVLYGWSEAVQKSHGWIVADLARPVTVTPQLGPGSPGGGAFVAEVVGYGVRGRTAWGRLGATNSCVLRTGCAFGDTSYAEVRRLEGLPTLRQGVWGCASPHPSQHTRATSARPPTIHTVTGLATSLTTHPCDLCTASAHPHGHGPPTIHIKRSRALPQSLLSRTG